MYTIVSSGVATGGSRGQSVPLDSETIPKNREKSEKIRKKEEKSGRKDKNQEGSFTLPLLTDRAGYAADSIIFGFKAESFRFT